MEEYLFPNAQVEVSFYDDGEFPTGYTSPHSGGTVSVVLPDRGIIRGYSSSLNGII